MEQKEKDMQQNVEFLITNISYGIRQYYGGLFAAYGVTYPQSRVLTRLFDQQGKGNVNQRDLERALGIKASSVSSLVRNLEHKGLITSERLPQDTRNKRILLTEKGMQLRTALEQAREKAEARLIAGLSREQVDQLAQNLEHLRLNLAEGTI